MRRTDMKKIITASMLAAALITAPAMNFAAAENKSSVPENKTYDTDDTLICIGSVSKMFATTAVMQLIDEGKVELDAPVTEYIPEFRMADERYKDITVRMLMNHTSGLMGTTAGDFMLYDDRDTATHDSFLEELSTQRLKTFPGDYGAYCNDGFMLLELIVERVSGESFTDYVEKNICRPMGMQQTGTPWNAFRTAEMVETFTGGDVKIAQDYCMDIGSGGIMSTAAELCSFGSGFFKGDNRLLSEKSKEEMSQTKVSDRYEDGFGLGWDQVDYPDYQAAGVKVVSKGGDVAHQHAELIVAPDEEISVAVLSSGGSSAYNGLIAQALMDIALEEKGIKAEHKAPDKLETLDKVPEKYLAYEDLYITSEALYRVSFPEGRYMEIKSVDEKTEVQNYMYTTEDNFVQVVGNIRNGKAVQPKDQTVLSFCKRNGRDYICTDSWYDLGGIGGMGMSAYYMQRAERNDVSAEVQASWDARSGRKYYLYNGKYSNTYYNGMPCIKLFTSPEAKGYISSGKIIDSDRAESALVMPGGRDVVDLAVRKEHGYEMIDMTNCALEYISEDAIPVLTEDITEVKLSTKKAVWYRTKDGENRTITLDIPGNAAVYVYDSFDRVVYSSYMKDYGSKVPLPSNGKIVFVGEDGGSIGITL